MMIHPPLNSNNRADIAPALREATRLPADSTNKRHFPGAAGAGRSINLINGAPYSRWTLAAAKTKTEGGKSEKGDFSGLKNCRRTGNQTGNSG
jgi:hypothetical protein